MGSGGREPPHSLLSVCHTLSEALVTVPLRPGETNGERNARLQFGCTVFGACCSVTFHASIHQFINLLIK